MTNKVPVIRELTFNRNSQTVNRPINSRMFLAVVISEKSKTRERLRVTVATLQKGIWKGLWKEETSELHWPKVWKMRISDKGITDIKVVIMLRGSQCEWINRVEEHHSILNR